MTESDLRQESMCRQLDSYLDGTLSEGEHRRFERHWPGCANCRREVETSRRVDRLLVEAHAQIKAPRELMARIHREIAARAQRRRARGALAAAASLLLTASVIGMWQWHAAPSESTLVHETTGTENHPPGQTGEGRKRGDRDDSSVARFQPGVRITSREDVIVVPVPTRRPDVTFVWLYTASDAVQNDSQ